MDTQAQITLYETLTCELGLTEREIMAHLSPSLGTVAREIGLPLTLKLIEGTRGKQVFLPVIAKEEYSITQLIGVDAATSVIKLFGEARHIIVSNPFNSRFMTRRKAINALKQGWSINEVANHFDVSFNSVRTWRKSLGMSGQTWKQREGDAV